MFSAGVDPGFVEHEASYNLELGELFTKKEYRITKTKLSIR